MPTPLLLGIDVGTTGTKAILSDANGTLLAQAGQEYPTVYPRPGWAEQDPEDWWAATGQVVVAVLDASGCSPADIAAVCVSSQAPTLVPVDRSGDPVGPALIWMDRRSEAQCEWLRRAVGDDVIAAQNGGRSDPYYLAPKLLWLREAARIAMRARTWCYRPTASSCNDCAAPW